MQLPQYSAPLPGGSGQWNSCYTLPHCLGVVGSGTPAIHCLTALGAVGSATPAMHCLTAWGQWAVDVLQRTAPLPGGSGQWNSCNTLPHCLGAVGSRIPAMHCLTALGAAGSATPAMHCLTAWGQWAVLLLQYTAALPGGSGLCNSCNALLHCPRAVGSATPATHCLTAWGQWAVDPPQCTAPLPWGQWAVQLLQCTDCLTAWGQWTVQLLQCTASLPGGSGQCTSCNALPHCPWAVGSATPAMH